MYEESSPKCFVIAGPNGAGKTTFALEYLPRVLCRNFINADEIARGLSPLDFEAGQFQAGKIFLDLLDQKIEQRQNFAFETTLSGRSYLPRLMDMQRHGWEIILIYIFIPNVEFSALRVMHRVRQGGHNVPPEEIQRRYPRSIANLEKYAKICNITLCLDNASSTPTLMFEKRFGQEITSKNGAYSITEMAQALGAMHTAVEKELKRKAKLGYNAVVLGKDGSPMVVQASTLVSL